MGDLELRLRQALSPDNFMAVGVEVDGDDVAVRDDGCQAWFAYKRADVEAWLDAAPSREAAGGVFGHWEPYNDFCRFIAG